MCMRSDRPHTSDRPDADAPRAEHRSRTNTCPAPFRARRRRALSGLDFSLVLLEVAGSSAPLSAPPYSIPVPFFFLLSNVPILISLSHFPIFCLRFLFDILISYPLSLFYYPHFLFTAPIPYPLSPLPI